MTNKWWQSSVVYQIYPKSFYDTNGDGIGDIQGIIQKLDYLEELGIDLIWLCPVYASPMDDNGYDISDYQAIAPEFGTMEDMDQLIDEANQRGIKLMMDLVINHTSDEHDWFAESKTNRHHPKRDWYIWRDGQHGGPPNEWKSVFGGSAWEYEPVTGQYYFHTFSKKQPDLNWENAEMRNELYHMIGWWMKKGIAGFRVDAITFIKKDFSLVVGGNDTIKPNQPGIELFLKELKEKAFDAYEAVTVAEAPGVSKQQLPRYIGDNGYFSMLFEFDHVDLDMGEEGLWHKPRPWALIDFKQAISTSQALFNKEGWGALYLENHDQPRSLDKFIEPDGIGPHAAKMLATVYFLLKGTPFIYQGQELGASNTTFQSAADFNDIASLDQFQSAVQAGLAEETALALVGARSRDNARTPMHWNDQKNGGFSTSTPWLPFNERCRDLHAEQRFEPDSVFKYYQQLIHLRKNSPYAAVFRDGQYEDVLFDHPDVFAYIRYDQDQKLAVVANFTNKQVDVALPFDVQEVLLSNSSSRESSTLQPYEAFVAVIS